MDENNVVHVEAGESVEVVADAPVEEAVESHDAAAEGANVAPEAAPAEVTPEADPVEAPAEAALAE